MPHPFSAQKSLEEALLHLFPPGVPGAVWDIHMAGIRLRGGSGIADAAHPAPLGDATAFRLASLSKSFTAAAVLQLVAEGALRLEDPLRQFFPAWNRERLGDPVVGHLLSHTAGLPDYENLIPGSARAPLSDADVLALILGKGRSLFTPGIQFRYSNTGYCLAALVVAAASAMPFGEWLQKRLFAPLGMTRTLVSGSGLIAGRALGYRVSEGRFDLDDQDITSATQGDGGVYTCLADYAKWLDTLTRHALPGGAGDVFSGPVAAVAGELDYVNGWFMHRDGEDHRYAFHTGETCGFRNLVILETRTGAHAVLLSNRSDDRLEQASGAIMRALGLRLPVPGPAAMTLAGRLHRIYEAQELSMP